MTIHKFVITRYALFFAALSFSPLIAAQVPEVSGSTQRPPQTTEDLAEQSGLLQRTLESLQFDRTFRWLEEQRDDMSRGVSYVGRSFDDWLAGDVEADELNESYVQIRLNQRIGRHDTYFSNARISGRLDLPRASERWKLIFESENREQNSLRDQRLSNINASDFTGGFSYEHPERNGWRINHDIGLRAKLPVDLFYRLRSRYSVDLNEDWYLGFTNRIYYYNQDGWGQDSRLFFTRTIDPVWNFRLETQVNYEHQERLTEFAQSFALHQQIGERENMVYELGLLGKNRPVSEVDSYFAQMVYRRAIYEDWLILEVVPQLLFEYRYDWEPDPRVQLNLEVYFFE
ncbi:hypothetical protein [Pseudohongiella spirulinae]|uniref:DUF481 domain-containing protein n=1 Tax=Pseudohongiella spirulinae TaxID=1249552 RepID=A0A0S2KBL4_9GAMM|nr:hypothetical protein [Pseudohongiella spirulinae]ALO45713.1 hypothetical protein PS2015_1048 [Pseudohongiella spirulinae]